MKGEVPMDHYLVIIFLIVGAGLFGGIANYFRLEREQKKSDWSWLIENVLMGILASALVPLFLVMISSNLLKESASDISKYFVFFGFCLVASVCSKAFIETVSERVLREVKQTREELDEVKKNVEPIVSKESEPHKGEDKSFIRMEGFSLDDNTKKVLNALGRGNFVWRTVGGIREETGIPKEDVLTSLNWLSSNKLAEAGARERWGLTLKGRDLYYATKPATEKSKE